MKSAQILDQHLADQADAELEALQQICGRMFKIAFWICAVAIGVASIYWVNPAGEFQWALLAGAAWMSAPFLVVGGAIAAALGAALMVAVVFIFGTLVLAVRDNRARSRLNALAP